MFHNLFSSSTLLDVPVLAMLGFFAVFVGVVIWVFSRRRREHYDEMSRKPLEDD